MAATSSDTMTANERELIITRVFDEGRPNRRPRCIAAVVGDRGLERRNHRVLSENGTDLVELRLLSVSISRLPPRRRFEANDSKRPCIGERRWCDWEP
jgi:hypothetical protein